MRIINLLINESVLKAEVALSGANADNVVARCRNYSRLLAEYRHHLSELGGIPEINLVEASALGRELVEQARRAVQAAIEITDREHVRTEALLDSLVSISRHQAVDTFNSLKYRDADDWAADADGVQRKLPLGREDTAEISRNAAAGATGTKEGVKASSVLPFAVQSQSSPSGSHSAGPGIEMLGLGDNLDDQAVTREIAIEHLTAEDAIEIAGRLRREAYVNNKTAF